MRFDLDGDGKLDAIERATMLTYFDRFRSEEDLDAILDEDDDLTFDGDAAFADDEYVLED